MPFILRLAGSRRTTRGFMLVVSTARTAPILGRLMLLALVAGCSPSPAEVAAPQAAAQVQAAPPTLAAAAPAQVVEAARPIAVPPSGSPGTAAAGAPAQALVSALAPEDSDFVDQRGGWGWSGRCLAHLQAGRLDYAGGACARGLEVATDARARGALYFNVGMVSEAQGDTAAARRAYQHSLRERPGNRAAQGKLNSLGSGTVEEGVAAASTPSAPAPPAASGVQGRIATDLAACDAYVAEVRQRRAQMMQLQRSGSDRLEEVMERNNAWLERQETGPFGRAVSDLRSIMDRWQAQDDDGTSTIRSRAQLLREVSARCQR